MQRPPRGFLHKTRADVGGAQGDERPAEGMNFRDWQLDLRTEQVRYVSLLTAGLYFAYAFIELYFTPDTGLGGLQVLRAVVVGSLLTSIALLSFHPVLRPIKRGLLMLAPVLAIAGNLYLAARGQPFDVYAPEIYLGLIWIFTVSGLNFRHAVLPAAVSVAMLVGHHIKYHPAQALPVLHVLWVVSALAFGGLGAFLLERRDRKIFEHRCELQRLAAFDDLTGLWNPRQIRESLAREIERSERTGAELSVILMDIDHFKRVNDRFGHGVGDVVLAELGELLRERVRSVDLVGRLGGEEFLVVLPNTGRGAAEQVAEKLREAIAAVEFSTGEPQTASFGVAGHQPGDKLDDLLERADGALYAAKRAGRNRVVAVGD